MWKCGNVEIIKANGRFSEAYNFKSTFLFLHCFLTLLRQLKFLNYYKKGF
jgi:hypothetical protein